MKITLNGIIITIFIFIFNSIKLERTNWCHFLLTEGVQAAIERGEPEITSKKF